MTLENINWSNWQTTTINGVLSMKISPDPYPYFYIENFFPDRLYDLLCKYWPNENFFYGQNEIAESPLAHQEANLRKVVLVDDTDDFMEDINAKSFWKNFRTMINSEELITSFSNRCYNHLIRERGEVDLPNCKLWSDALLQSDNEGYLLGPHHDSKHTLISNIIYLPNIKDKKAMGTIVYEPKPEYSKSKEYLGRKYDNKYHDVANFNEVFRAPYKPNCLFGFVNSPRSFHGLDAIDKDSSGRRNILWSLNLSKKKPYRSVYKRLKIGHLTDKSKRREDDLFDYLLSMKELE